MEEGKDTAGFDRRTFLKRAAATGAVVWAIPAVQTIAAGPAFASSRGSNPTGDCSTCNGACNAADGNACLAMCIALCPGGNGHGNGCAGGICCNPGLFDSANFCSPPPGRNDVACYFGPINGCPSYNTTCAHSGHGAVCYTKDGPSTNSCC